LLLFQCTEMLKAQMFCHTQTMTLANSHQRYNSTL